MQVRLIVLDEDTNDAADLTVDLPKPPLTFDELVNAYDDVNIGRNDFTDTMKSWARVHLWPQVVQYRLADNTVSVLVTFLDSDPKGESEMEFFMKSGRLM